MDEKIIVPIMTDYASMITYLSEITEKYDTVSVSYIGTSLYGRAIPVVSLGNEKSDSAVLYVATHHASERICSAVLLNFIKDYCTVLKNSSSVRGITANLLNSTKLIYIIPMLNPDGVELQIHGINESCPIPERIVKMNGGYDFTHWQANGRGVDLNHNYDSGFSEYKRLEKEKGITDGAPTRYSGLYAESEPEVAYLCNFVRFNNHIKAALSLHTQGEEIYYTGNGGKTVAESEKKARIIGSMTGYRVTEPEGASSHGGMTDWFIDALGKPSFTLECGKGVNPLPESDFISIYNRLRETLFSFPMLF